MHPAFDPVWIVAGGVVGGMRGGAGSAAENSVAKGITVKSEHFFVQHFAGTGLTEAEINAAIRQSVQTTVRGASSTGSFWGKATVRGQLIEYRAWTLPNGEISVGTAYPWPK